MPTALIVDDLEENLYLLRSLLQANGFDVVAATNGQAALDLAAAGVPDIVISDILMPVMDGFSLCRRWRGDDRLRDVPFVFYTATYTDPRDEQLALDAGADLFLVKPLEPDLFLERIADVLRRRGTGDLAAARHAATAEAGYLKEYNEALIRKLEDKLAQLTEANRRLLVKDAAIASATSGIALVDLDGRITYANAAMGRVLGCDDAGIAGRLIEDVLGPPAVLVIERDVRDGGAWAGEVTTTDPSGSERILEGVVHAVVEGPGRPLCRMMSFQDVTDRRRLAEQVQRSQRLASLSLFAGGIAHDFNNLLTGLFGSIELAKADLPTGSPALAFLESATVAFERSRDLTGRLLSFAKGSPPARRALSVGDLLRECCSLAFSGASISWEITGPSRPWAVLGDANQLAQVFTNILVNARQAMPQGGVVRIATEHREGGGLVPGSPAGRFVEVSVSDQGPGIPEGLLQRVFDPLFTTKPGGSGLGLAMCHSIVRAHGGTICAVSPRGGGATFRVLLPAGPDGETGGESDGPGTAGSADTAGGGRVLVMDDEQAIRDMAARMLTRGGFDVQAVADGDEALAACAEASRAGRPFDLAILDVTVRGGMGGRETLACLRERHPEIAVVLSSGYTEASWLEQCRPDGVLPKPYQMHELLACARAVGGQRRPSRPPSKAD